MVNNEQQPTEVPPYLAEVLGYRLVLTDLVNAAEAVLDGEFEIEATESAYRLLAGLEVALTQAREMLADFESKEPDAGINSRVRLRAIDVR